MTTYDVLFTIAGTISVAAALLAVSTKHLVHSALWLIVSLASLSGCYLVLGAEFVALVQLLVYVGAIVVLVLFALMLTRAPIGRSAEHDTSRVQRAAALVVGAATAALLASVLISAFGNDKKRVNGGGTHLLAARLFGSWVWPFEVLSALLLVALVAALALARLPIGPRGDADGVPR
ncbi:NADH-quinone oxidoreductase subunit J family protein [Flexivirga caeni]|uniref:NADH-quinone oxidoreductase subunit J n=1 Tax=Flexivirga caeni TaxID=2294115 RepID=A0A3M9M7V6_9MICO|nr:NADH-quinone oxidoreductase subunit J [Flexivirga caeni]RNI21654.1 NADH-quinone oxidoreductase subunit J [Flexivirga caeni]